MQSAATEERIYRYQHQANNSSYSSDNNTQRSASIGPARSDPRPLAASHSHTNTNVTKTAANFSKPVPTSPESRRRQVASHHRSNSIGSVNEGVGNLNRWSQSTTSSKGSPAHTRSNSLSRRMSFGTAGAFNFGSNKPDNPSNHHLQKANIAGASTVEGPLQRTSSRQSEGSTNPSMALPPIITLPSHQRIVSGSDQESPQTSTTISPSTAGLLSAAVHSAAPDYFGRTWDDPNSRIAGRSSSKTRSPINPSSLSVAPGNTRSTDSPVHRHRQERERSRSRGHSRNRSHTTKGSSGTVSSDKNKDRSSKPPSQKAMLSKALQKANTAVVLDNAQNFEGAMEAYSEACDLLQQVMLRSSGDEDRRKLEAIRNTYTSRISELEMIGPYNEDDKALPARPESGDYRDEFSPIGEDDDMTVIGMAVATRIVNHDSYVPEPYVTERRPSHIQPSQVPRRRDSLLPSPFDAAPVSKYSAHLGGQYVERSVASRSPMQQGLLDVQSRLSPPMERQSMMVPPLSPRRPLSPVDTNSQRIEDQRRMEPSQSSDPFITSSDNTHRRNISTESMSWLDTIDESGGSTASSVHSRTSSLGVRRKHIRAASGATEAEFDAALDAAVEAAYDDGFEPIDDGFEPIDEEEVPNNSDEYEDELANMRIRVEMARERVRETERETAIHLARDRERARLAQEFDEQQRRGDDEYYDDESEEEERMLEEMTRGYVMDDFEFGLQSKSALPRESDSSGFSGRTWHSSLGSNPTTGGTTMSTITEASLIPQLPMLQLKMPPPPHPPPGQVLPPPPTSVNAPQFSRPLQMQASEPITVPHTVRNRRLSGQNPKQLKIETTPKAMPKVMQPASQPPTMLPPDIPSEPVAVALPARDEMPPPPLPQTVSSISNRMRQGSSPLSPTEVTSPPTPTLTQNFNLEDDSALPRSGSPGRTQSRSGLRKNFSSSSLKNLKGRNLSVSHIEDGFDVSPNTPMIGQFSASRGDVNKPPAVPALPTPMTAAFRDKMSGIPTGGLYLFDSDIHSPETPGSPNINSLGAPIPLEPCPTEYLLRPFWLMRAFYQTLVHTRGGYLSTKLFVPRDVWRVKGVKIKGLEEKIACCDFLTAALQKLAQVDTFDADAVLDEMQALEDVLEHARGMLARKLGNEVGVQGSGMLFKDAPPATDADTGPTGSRTTSMPTKSSSFSWRRLRSKSSGVALNTYGGRTPTSDGPKEALTMSTVPMTTLTSIRFAKRDISQAQFTGPNSTYMGALARLFDAVQVLDQIARQVEDPGLRHADKTQVGLELSTRHAAEFFGFYVCRFVLTDIGLLLDKFIKRGSEWVVI